MPRYSHITNFFVGGEREVVYVNSVAIYNSLFPNALSIGRASRPNSLQEGLWMNNNVRQDMELFWLIFDGFRFRKVRDEVSIETLLRIC